MDLLFSLLLLLLLVAIYFLLVLKQKPIIVREAFVDKCQAKFHTQEELDAMMEVVIEAINNDLIYRTEVQDIGPIKITGIDTVSVTAIDVGPETMITSCSNGCVCDTTGIYPKTSSITTSKANVTIEIPGLKIGTGIGIFVAYAAVPKLTVNLTGVNATIQTDCDRSIAITDIDFEAISVVGLEGESSVVSGLVRSFISDKKRMKSLFGTFIAGLKFDVQDGLGNTPLICAA